jgi:hypothetical protein
MAGEGMGAQWECVGRSYFLRCCEGGTTVKIPLIEREPDLTTGDGTNFLLSYYPYTNLANLFLSIR